jgi:hypothetical protein
MIKPNCEWSELAWKIIGSAVEVHLNSKDSTTKSSSPEGDDNHGNHLNHDQSWFRQ